MDPLGTRQPMAGSRAANLVSSGPRASMGEGITESPCRACPHFEAGIERKICREYDDCLLNHRPVTAKPADEKQTPSPPHEASQGTPDQKSIDYVRCKACGARHPHTAEFFQKNRWGLMSVCKACLKKKQNSGRSVYKPKKPIKYQSIAEKEDKPKLESKKKEKIVRRRVELPIDQPELIKDVERYAIEDFRSFSQEVAFILTKYRNYREANGKRETQST